MTVDRITSKYQVHKLSTFPWTNGIGNFLHTYEVKMVANLDKLVGQVLLLEGTLPPPKWQTLYLTTRDVSVEFHTSSSLKK